MTDADFDSLESFIKLYNSEFCGFDELDLTGVRGKSLKDRFISWLYFTQRKLRGIK